MGLGKWTNATNIGTRYRENFRPVGMVLRERSWADARESPYGEPGGEQKNVAVVATAGGSEKYNGR